MGLKDHRVRLQLNKRHMHTSLLWCDKGYPSYTTRYLLNSCLPSHDPANQPRFHQQPQHAIPYIEDSISVIYNLMCESIFKNSSRAL